MLLPGETVQSQYAASPAIRALAESFRVRIAPDADISLFYSSIFNIETARGIGLDIWGRILGIGRAVDIDVDEDCFGFMEAGFDPFDTTPFRAAQGLTSVYNLDDEAFRQLLMWKALANISTADAASLNRLLYLLFGKDIVVHEWGVMAIELYIFSPLESFEKTILENYGLIAKGAAVGFDWIEIPLPVFGFHEADYETFDNAPFWEKGETA